MQELEKEKIRIVEQTKDLELGGQNEIALAAEPYIFRAVDTVKAAENVIQKDTIIENDNTMQRENIIHKEKNCKTESDSYDRKDTSVSQIHLMITTSEELEPAHESKIPLSNNLNSPKVTLKDEEESVLDTEIKAINDYYNQKEDECYYDEDFEDFQECVIETKPSQFLNTVSNDDLVSESSSTCSEELENYLRELDHKVNRTIQNDQVKEELPTTYTDGSPLPPSFEEKVLLVVPIVAENGPAANNLTSEQADPTNFTLATSAVDLGSQNIVNASIEQLSSNSSSAPNTTETLPLTISSPNFKEKKIDQKVDPTDQSVSRILSFLKTVEQEPIQLQTSPQITSSWPGSSFMNPTLSSSIFDDVKQKIMASQLEIREKGKTIHVLQQELARLKEVHKKDMEEVRKGNRSQLSLQRKEYETIVKRHLAFIDNVLAEKESLSSKVVELTEKVSEMEKKFKQKVTDMESSHLKHLGQQKELWQTQERIKREKWVQDRTRQIKDQTIQSLEPEIQKLIATHKSALRAAEEEYRTRLQNEKTSMMEGFQNQLDKLREKHISDRQKACEEEREFARERYSKQLEREEMEVF